MRIVKVNKDSIANILSDLLKRSPTNYGDFQDKVDAIIKNVRDNGDKAVFDYTAQFDKAEINADGELVITYTDGEVVNLGKVVGADGKDGLTPFIGENGNWWIGEKDTGVKAVADVAVPAGFGNISEGNISEPASSPALVAIGSVAGVALLGNLGLILYIVLKKKKV